MKCESCICGDYSPVFVKETLMVAISFCNEVDNKVVFVPEHCNTCTVTLTRLNVAPI